MDLNIGRGYSDGMSRPTLNMGRDIPKDWRRDSDFVQKFKQLLRSKGTCEAHDMNCSGESVACLTCFRSLCDVCQHSDGHWIDTCDKCGVTMCDEFCENFAHCNGCDTTFCSVCKEDDDVDAALRCDKSYPEDCYCDGNWCLSCGGGCDHCIVLHVPRLETLVERLADDNETLKNENNQLRQENKQLRQENKVV